MAISKSKREEVYQKYNGHCAYCGREIAYKDMQVDHFLPLRAWGIEISPFSELFDDVLRVFAVVTLNPSIGKDFNVSGALVAHVNQQRLR